MSKYFNVICIVCLFLVPNIVFCVQANRQIIRVLTSQPGVVALNSSVDVIRHLEEVSNLKFDFSASQWKYSDQRFDAACEEKLSRSHIDACLVMKSSKSKGLLTDDLVTLSPALVFQTTQNGTVLNFTRVFHSSVWSFLLLAVLVSCGLLTAFEYFHPFGYGLQSAWNYQDQKKLDLVDAVHLIIGGLFLKGPNKTPVSLPGNILLLTWAAFSFCTASLFIAGTVVSVFATQTSPSRFLSQPPKDLGSLSIACPEEDTFCHLARHMPCSAAQSERCAIVKRTKTNDDEAGTLERQLSAPESKIGLITDSFAAVQMLQANDKLAAVRMGTTLASIAFRVSNASLHSQLNPKVLETREKGARSKDSMDTKLGQREGDSGGALLSSLAGALPIRLALIGSVFGLLLFGIGLSIVALLSEFIARTFVWKDHKQFSIETAENPMLAESAHFRTAL